MFTSCLSEIFERIKLIFIEVEGAGLGQEQLGTRNDRAKSTRGGRAGPRAGDLSGLKYRPDVPLCVALGRSFHFPKPQFPSL